MRQSVRLFALMIIAVVVACVPQVTVTPVGPTTHFDAVADSVPVQLFTTTKPDCPYDEVAAISAEISEGWSANDKVTEAIKQRARSVGATAIIGYTQGKRDMALGRGEFGNMLTRSGTAIRFKSADCLK